MGSQATLRLVDNQGGSTCLHQVGEVGPVPSRGRVQTGSMAVVKSVECLRSCVEADVARVRTEVPAIGPGRASRQSGGVRLRSDSAPERRVGPAGLSVRSALMRGYVRAAAAPTARRSARPTKAPTIAGTLAPSGPVPLSTALEMSAMGIATAMATSAPRVMLSMVLRCPLVLRAGRRVSGLSSP